MAVAAKGVGGEWKVSNQRWTGPLRSWAFPQSQVGALGELSR